MASSTHYGAGWRAHPNSPTDSAEEPFFKGIKQHLRIKTFFGTPENAVKSQIWIAVCIDVPVAIVRKRLKLEALMHETPTDSELEPG